MHRFFIPPESWNPDKLMLDAAQAHHALDVVRLEKGARAVVFNGQGTEATVEITGVDKQGAHLRRIHHSKSAPLPCAITLGQAIPKGKNMDLIVQKATELGAAAVAPILSERTVIQYDAEEAEKKQAKWQTVAIEAAKQCGQNWLPAIHRPQTLKEFFNARRRSISCWWLRSSRARCISSACWRNTRRSTKKSREGAGNGRPRGRFHAGGTLARATAAARSRSGRSSFAPKPPRSTA